MYTYDSTTFDSNKWTKFRIFISSKWGTSKCLSFFICLLSPNLTIFLKNEPKWYMLELFESHDADLGVTYIPQSLTEIFNQKPQHWQHQIFILTDCEKNDVKVILQLF